MKPRFGRLGREYGHVVFDKGLLEDNPTLEWVTPGHPLFEVVRADVGDKTTDELMRGSVFYDIHRKEPSRLDVYSGAVQDGRGNVVHRRLSVVESAMNGATSIRQPTVRLDWRNVRCGHEAVVKELKQYLRDIQEEPGGLPDLVVAATDANCKGLVERTRVLSDVTGKAGLRIVCAVPDPHIERWLLLDSAAFKAVFGQGCGAPDRKCERARYKKMLIDAIRESGIAPSLGGIEFAEEIVKEMHLDRMARSDDSLGRLLGDLDAVFREWRQ